MKILFFSRGRGRGHAIPDIAVYRELLKINPKVHVSFVSYSSGAETFAAHHCPLIELDLPENNPVMQTLVQCVECIRNFNPDIIVSHEEFAAIPAAKSMGVPSIFLTDWFPPEHTVISECITHADQVLFADSPGFADEPPLLKGKVTYLGPVLADVNSGGWTKARARDYLGIDAQTMAVLVVPGGASSSSEQKAPIIDIVIDAFQLIPIENKQLVWVAGQADIALLSSYADKGIPLLVLPVHAEIGRTMLAADVGITKGNRITVLEMNSLGIPSLSLSVGLNPIDDMRISRIGSNVALRMKGTNATLLASHLAELAQCENLVAIGDGHSGRMRAAAEILKFATSHQRVVHSDQDRSFI